MNDALPHPRFAFAAATFDRGGEQREDQDWMTSVRQDRRAQVVTVTPDGRLGLTADGTALARVRLHELEDPGVFLSASLLGFEDGIPIFAIAAGNPQVEASTSGLWSDLRAIAASLPAHDAGLAAYARALLHWQSCTRFCGRCGQAAHLIAGGHRAICSDAACGNVYFPRTDAAVIVLVEHSQRALLGRQAAWGPNRFSTLAGFVEPGETLEDAVRREVREESGVRVDDVEYQASQPWPFPASLMIGFRARASNEAIEVGDEIVEARWFSPDDIDRDRATGALKLSPPLSISRWLLGTWYREQTGRDLVD